MPFMGTKKRHGRISLGLGFGFGMAGRRAAVGYSGPLYDLFLDVNGTAITTHVMDVGPGWVELLGDGDIQTNKLQSVTSGVPMLLSAVSGYSNCTVGADITFPGSGQYCVGPGIRIASAISGLACLITNDDGTNTYLTYLLIGGG